MAYKHIESLDEGDHGLFIVADGMGGYQAGEIASKLAVETISQAMDSFFKSISDQPTIRLSPLESVDSEATITYPTTASTEAEAKRNKTVKLPETAISQSVEEQFTAAIQKPTKPFYATASKKLLLADWAALLLLP